MASKLQVTTYLLGICLFSICFLVFVNASISFVITDIIHQKDNVGNAAGTLGFADELLALVACPAWGVLSDRLGFRGVRAMPIHSIPDLDGNLIVLTISLGICNWLYNYRRVLVRHRPIQQRLPPASTRKASL